VTTRAASRRARPARRHACLWLVLAAGVVLVSSCGVPRFGAPPPVTDDGERILSLWQGSVVAALAVGALVWGLIAYSVIRYRRRDDRLPDQTAHNVPLEVVYTVTPIVIVAILFGFTVLTQEKVTGADEPPDVVVEVVGFQWQWQFRYPGEGVVVTGTPGGDPPVMVLPVGSTVRLQLATTDVVHSFWVPRFLDKRDLIPGVRNEIQFRVEQAGSFAGRCAEFCGLDHYKMHFEVRAVPPAEYDEWLARQRAPMAAAVS
jgi:cytochrome c oxidase subunit 2